MSQVYILRIPSFVFTPLAHLFMSHDLLYDMLITPMFLLTEGDRRTLETTGTNLGSPLQRRERHWGEGNRGVIHTGWRHVG